MSHVAITHKGPAKTHDVMGSLISGNPALLTARLEGMSVNLASIDNEPSTLSSKMEPLPSYPPKTGQEERTVHYYNRDGRLVLSVRQSPQRGSIAVHPIGSELEDSSLEFLVVARIRQAN